MKFLEMKMAGNIFFMEQVRQMKIMVSYLKQLKVDIYEYFILERLFLNFPWVGVIMRINFSIHSRIY